MNSFSPLLAAFSLPDISPYLTKGVDAGNGVTLMIGDLYTWLLLGGGPLLVLGALALVRVMFVRVKFFALEFGNGGFFGRLMAIGPSIAFGGLLFLTGGAATWLGWQSQGYAVTLNASGLSEMTRGGVTRFTWDDVNLPGSSKHVKSTDFGVAFAKDGRQCRVRFQQRYIGAELQDKAIAITENALPRRF